MNLPSGFVYLSDIDPSITVDLKYFTYDNFIGRPIKGYEAAVCIMTKETALALQQIQIKLIPQSLSLKIFDAYRPQTAVNDFVAWTKDPDDQVMKDEYYPNVNKAKVVELGYLSQKSSHTRGSTVDLTIVKLQETGHSQELPMGTQFDFFDETSHTLCEQIKGEAHDNRILLRDLMIAAGFEPYDKEWWHFTLKNEPFPDTYFDFPVK